MWITESVIASLEPIHGALELLETEFDGGISAAAVVDSPGNHAHTAENRDRKHPENPSRELGLALEVVDVAGEVTGRLRWRIAIRVCHGLHAVGQLSANNNALICASVSSAAAPVNSASQSSPIAGVVAPDDPQPIDTPE